MHPLLHLIAARPQLLADHAQAYAELVAEEVERASAQWKRSASLYAAAVLGATIALALAGVALMLWAVVPDSQMRGAWALIVVPLVPLAAALACLMVANKAGGRAPFDELRQQATADIVMLREWAAA